MNFFCSTKQHFASLLNVVQCANYIQFFYLIHNTLPRDHQDCQRMIVDLMFMIIQNLRFFFLTAVTPAVVILWKHHENRKKLPWEHLIGCWGGKSFLLKDVTIITVTTATVTNTTVTISVFKFCHNFFVLSLVTNRFLLIVSQFEFWSFVTFCFSEFCHNSSYWVLSRFEFSSFVTIFFCLICLNSSFWVLSQF